jgi:hypothetical protein
LHGFHLKKGAEKEAYFVYQTLKGRQSQAQQVSHLTSGKLIAGYHCVDVFQKF